MVASVLLIILISIIAIYAKWMDSEDTYLGVNLGRNTRIQTFHYNNPGYPSAIYTASPASLYDRGGKIPGLKYLNFGEESSVSGGPQLVKNLTSKESEGRAELYGDYHIFNMGVVFGRNSEQQKLEPYILMNVQWDDNLNEDTGEGVNLGNLNPSLKL